MDISRIGLLLNVAFPVIDKKLPAVLWKTFLPAPLGFRRRFFRRDRWRLRSPSGQVRFRCPYDYVAHSCAALPGPVPRVRGVTNE